jgi:hypothetical protein
MSHTPSENPDDARRRLIGRSVEDEDLRQRLLADPKGTVEQELGAKLPEGVEIRAVEETPDTVYLVLPPKAPVAADQGGELSDRELEAVAGGWDQAAGTSDETCAPRGIQCRPRL